MKLRVGLLAGIATLWFAAPAVAGTAITRYAEPGGNGADPCAPADPCDIQNAVETVADPGDLVVLLAGTYALGSDELQIANNVDVDGQDPASDTIITSSADYGVRIVFASTSSFLSDVTIEHNSETAQSAGLSVEGGTAERVSVESASSYGCFVTGLVRDSICVNSDATGGVGAGLFSPVAATGTLRNVTAVAVGTTGGHALFASATGANNDSVVLHGRNVIAQGALADQGGFDSTTGSGASHIDLDYSNFDTLGDFINGATGTDVDTLSNQSDPPLLDADYRQLPGSPTIDAGDSTATLLGQFDLDLEPRIQNGIPDIGEDEIEPDLTSPDTVITEKPPKRTRKRAAVFQFESPDADANAFECKLDGKPYKPCNSGKVKYKNLKRKRHTFRVRAVDDSDNADPTPAKYTWKVKRPRR